MSELNMRGNAPQVPGIPPSDTPRNACPDPAVACGCCEGTEPITPQSTANRPGLAALAYRIGTHATFLETMKARLSSHCLGDPQECAKGGGTRPLAALTTRENNDPAIALLDAWATVGDVLTFYQERIANEGYLRTATERRSILELSRLIGYSPRPGVAASVYLAYTLDDNTKEEVLIPAGARVQSVPGPGELPQSFETSEDLKSRAAWNRLGPRKTVPQRWKTIWDDKAESGNKAESGKLYLKGIATNLMPNDPLLIKHSGKKPDLYRVTAVTPDPAVGRTQVTITPWARVDAAESIQSLHAIAEHFIESAPAGKTADGIVAHLREMSDVSGRATESQALVRLLDEETFPMLKSAAEQSPERAARLNAWLSEVHGALTKVREAIGPVEVGKAAAIDYPSFTLLSVPLLNTLIKKPSRPLPNALQLPRTLASSFRPSGDAGLKALGLASLDLRESLGAAISNSRRVSDESQLEVYALRLKAGVFGRNAPKRTKTKRTTESNGEETETEVIGEWPIVTNIEYTNAGPKFVATESERTIFLDNNYDRILPESWLVLDSTAVPDFQQRKEVVLVEPAVFRNNPKPEGKFLKYLVAQAREVTNKVARAEYGITGDSVRIELSKEWLRFIAPPSQV